MAERKPVKLTQRLVISILLTSDKESRKVGAPELTGFWFTDFGDLADVKQTTTEQHPNRDHQERNERPLLSIAMRKRGQRRRRGNGRQDKVGGTRASRLS